jgi:hypothetical protein
MSDKHVFKTRPGVTGRSSWSRVKIRPSLRENKESKKFDWPGKTQLQPVEYIIVSFYQNDVILIY